MQILFNAAESTFGCFEATRRYIDKNGKPLAFHNNHIEIPIRPVSLGKGNWFFAGSLRAGQRAASVASLIQSAKLNGHDPYRYINDSLERSPTQRASQVVE